MTQKLPEELISKNPMEQIPVLEFTDSRTGEVICLTQSLAIIEFIDELTTANGGVSIFPTDPLVKARIRQVPSAALFFVLFC